MSDQRARTRERDLAVAPDAEGLARAIADRRRAGIPAGDLLDGAARPPHVVEDAGLSLGLHAEMAHGEVLHVGDTPGRVEVPASVRWWAVPGTPRRLYPALVDFARRNVTPGLCLYKVPLEGGQLALLRDLPELEWLSLERARLDDQGLLALPALPALHTLGLALAKLSAKGLAPLAALPLLTRLSLDKAALGDADLSALSGLLGLERLSLCDTRVGEEGLAVLPPSLTHLVADGCGRIEGRSLGRLTRLDSLSLCRSQVGAEGLAALAGTTSLRRLRLRGCRCVRLDGLAAISRAPGLEELDLSGCAVGEHGVEELARLRGLRRLSLWYSEVGDAGLRHLAGHPGLEALRIGGAGLTGAGLTHLAGLPRLRELVFSAKTLDEPALLAFLEARPTLRLLDVRAPGIALPGLHELERAGRFDQLVCDDPRVLKIDLHARPSSPGRLPEWPPFAAGVWSAYGQLG